MIPIFIIGLIVGFFVGTCTGIVVTCFATVTKRSDKQAENYEKSKND